MDVNSWRECPAFIFSSLLYYIFLKTLGDYLSKMEIVAHFYGLIFGRLFGKNGNSRPKISCFLMEEM